MSGLGWVGSKVNLIENDRSRDKIDAIDILCFSLMIFAITCHVPSAKSFKAINAFGSLSSDIARKPFDRAMRRLSYLKYASDTYQAIRIVCTVCQNMPNTFNFASFDTLISNLTESFILPKQIIFHFVYLTIAPVASTGVSHNVMTVQCHDRSPKF